MNRQSASLSAVVWILTICVAANLVYGRSLHFFFSQDDFVFLARAARTATWKEFIDAVAAVNHFYRPVPRVAMFVLQLRLFGLNAGAFHLISLGLHTLNAILLFLLCQRLFSATLLAGLSGFLYVTHSMPFLAVYWVSGIQDLCAASFLLISLLMYIHSIETQGYLWLIFSLLAYTLALLSKEISVTFPVLLILIESVRARQVKHCLRLGQLTRKVLGYGILLGLYLLVRSRKATIFLPTEGPYVWDFAPGTLLKNFRFYLYDSLYVHSWPIMPQWAAWATILVAFAVSIRCSPRYRPVIALGVGWFVTALLPVLFLSQRAYSFYAYFPLIGMSIALGALVSMILGGLPPQARFLSFSIKPTRCAMKSIGILLFLIGWLSFSVSQVQAVEARDPAGIISKSVLAYKAMTEVKALYPDLPMNSTLYVVGLTERDVWAFGHGDLFRLCYPHVNVVLVSQGEESRIAALNADGDYYVYHFSGEGE